MCVPTNRDDNNKITVDSDIVAPPPPPTLNEAAEALINSTCATLTECVNLLETTSLDRVFCADLRSLFLAAAANNNTSSNSNDPKTMLTDVIAKLDREAQKGYDAFASAATKLKFLILEYNRFFQLYHEEMDEALATAVKVLQNKVVFFYESTMKLKKRLEDNILEQHRLASIEFAEQQISASMEKLGLVDTAAADANRAD